MDNVELFNGNCNLLRKFLFHHMKMKEIHKAALCLFQFCLQPEQILLWHRFCRLPLFSSISSKNVHNWPFFLYFLQGETMFHCVVLASLELTKINLLSDGIRGVYYHTPPLFVSLLILPYKTLWITICTWCIYESNCWRILILLKYLNYLSYIWTRTSAHVLTVVCYSYLYSISLYKHVVLLRTKQLQIMVRDYNK